MNRYTYSNSFICSMRGLPFCCSFIYFSTDSSSRTFVDTKHPSRPKTFSCEISRLPSTHTLYVYRTLNLDAPSSLQIQSASAALISACVHDPVADALPRSCILDDPQIHAITIQVPSEFGHTSTAFCISE